MERERGKPMDEMHPPGGEHMDDAMSAPEGEEHSSTGGTPSSEAIDRVRPGTRSN